MSSFFSNPLVLVVLLVLVLLLFLFIVASMMVGGQNAANAIGAKQAGMPSFVVHSAPLEVLQSIQVVARKQGYEVENVDHSLGRVILSSPGALSGLGYYYPVYISGTNGTDSLVEVGVLSKMPRFGSIIKGAAARRQTKFLTSLKAGLAPPIMR